MLYVDFLALQNQNLSEEMVCVDSPYHISCDIFIIQCLFQGLLFICLDFTCNML